MYIKRISIKNYRSCISCNWAPNKELSVLIGPNGSGKTNTLSAMKLLKALAGMAPTRRGNKDPAAVRATIRTVFSVDGIEVTHTAKIGVSTNERNLDEVTEAQEFWIIPSSKRETAKLSFPSWFLKMARQNGGARDTWGNERSSSFYGWLKRNKVEDKTISSLLKIHDFMHGISYYGASQFTNPASAPVSFEVEGDEARRIGISISGHKKFLFDLYQDFLGKTTSYQQYLSLAGPEGIGLVEALSFNEINTSSSSYTVKTGGGIVTKEKINKIIVPQFQVSGGVTLSPNQLSEGTFKTLALLYYLVTDKSSLLMIEEPEVCIHHGLLSSVIETIKSYSADRQTIISTHSDLVLDRIELGNVFSVRRDPELGTLVSSVGKSIKGARMKALKDYLHNEGNLGEYWRHGELEEA